jgi:hypothetical protein
MDTKIWNLMFSGCSFWCCVFVEKKAIDSDVTGNRIRMNNKLAKKYLSEAKKAN